MGKVNGWIALLLVACAAGVSGQAVQPEDPKRVAWTLDAMQAEWDADHGWAWKDNGPRVEFPDQHVWTARTHHVPEANLQVIAVGRKVKYVTVLVTPGSEETVLRLAAGLTVAGSQISAMTGMDMDRLGTWMRWCLEDDSAAIENNQSPGHQAIEKNGYRVSWQMLTQLGSVMVSFKEVDE